MSPPGKYFQEYAKGMHNIVLILNPAKESQVTRLKDLTGRPHKAIQKDPEIIARAHIIGASIYKKHSGLDSYFMLFTQRRTKINQRYEGLKEE